MAELPEMAATTNLTAASALLPPIATRTVILLEEDRVNWCYSDAGGFRRQHAGSDARPRSSCRLPRVPDRTAQTTRLDSLPGLRPLWRTCLNSRVRVVTIPRWCTRTSAATGQPW